MVVAQNGVEQKDIAVATATLSFLRSLGGSVCVTVFQAVFNNDLSGLWRASASARWRVLISDTVPCLGAGGASGGHSLFDVTAVQALPRRIFIPFMTKFTSAMDDSFKYIVPLVVVAAIAMPFLSGSALRTSNAPVTPKAGDAAVATPAPIDVAVANEAGAVEGTKVAAEGVKVV